MSEKIGILLPLQLETKFVSHNRTPEGRPLPPYDLWLRVIPQPPSVDQHTGYVSDGEMDAIKEFRKAIGESGILQASWLTDEHQVAFERLVAAVGGGRALWLAEHTSAEIVGDQVSLQLLDPQEDDAPAAVRGLPARLTVAIWTNTGGQESIQGIGELPQRTTAIPEELPLPTLEDPESVHEHWLTDFELAQDVGLGGIFPLPDDLGPADLGGITVWGLGEHTSEELITHHIFSGQLAELPLGVATASVNGRSSATTDEGDWWRTLKRRLDGTQTSLDRLVGQFLTGTEVPSMPRSDAATGALYDLHLDRDQLGRYADPIDIETAAKLRTGWINETSLSRLLMQALWPVLWGEQLLAHGDDPNGDPGDLFDQVAALTDWALENVHPEGPLPSLRLDDQPYGVLPLTRMDAWTAAATANRRPDVLERLARVTTGVRRDRHDALARTGTVRDKGPGGYADLLSRGGASKTFGQRTAIPFGSLQNWSWAEYWLKEQIHERATVGIDPPDEPLDRVPLIIPGGAGTVGLPLVHPRYWTALGRGQDSRDWRRIPMPMLLCTAWGDWRWLEPYTNDPRLPTNLAELFQRDPSDPFQPLYYHTVPDGWEDGTKMMGVLRVAPESLLTRLMLQSVLTLNRWEAAGLDPVKYLLYDAERHATHSALLQLAALLDPDDDPARNEFHGEHIAGLTPAFQTEPNHPLVTRLERALGATLDTMSGRIDPWITAFAWERLKAVSKQPGALRQLGAYGWVQGPFDGEPGPTAAGLLHAPSLAQAQVATLARDHYRRGITNERGERVWGMALSAPAVRIATGLIADYRDGHHPDEVVGREVERIAAAHVLPTSSVYRALADLRTTYPLNQKPDPRQVCKGSVTLAALLTESRKPVPSHPHLDLSEARQELEELQAGIEAMAQLNLLDGALHLATGSPERAAATMEAASMGAPPEPEFPRTPASARELRTTVLSMLPWRESTNEDHAAALADPSVAGYLAATLGLEWVWQVELDDGTRHDVTLADLGLQPIDTLTLPASLLRRAAAIRFGLAGSQGDDGGFEGGSVVDPPELAEAARLVGLLGAPATEQDLPDAGEQELPGMHISELADRHRKVREDLEATIKELDKAIAEEEEAGLLAAIDRGARWGSVPGTTLADEEALAAVLGRVAFPETATPPEELAAAMLDALTKRLAPPTTAPVELEGEDPEDDEDELEPEPELGLDQLAKAISGLAAPQGNLAILARWQRSALLDRAGLRPQENGELTGGWLETLAHVRAPLARLAAAQSGPHPLRGWASSEDPWLVADLAALPQDAERLFDYETPRLVAAFGPGDAMGAATLAVGVIDAWREDLPTRHRDTHAAFGFNAPAAQAPRAILLAVPPNPGDDLTDDDVGQMLSELRASVVARSWNTPWQASTWLAADGNPSPLAAQAFYN